MLKRRSGSAFDLEGGQRMSVTRVKRKSDLRAVRAADRTSTPAYAIGA